MVDAQGGLVGVEGVVEVFAGGAPLAVVVRLGGEKLGGVGG